MPRPATPAPLPRPVGWLLEVAALAALYYAAARLGLRYASIGQSISLVWPPTGLAIAALVIFGPRAWPGIAAGAFLANAATAVPLGAAAGIAAGNTLEAVLAAALLVRASGRRPRLEDMRTARTLILVAAPAGALVSALVGVTTLMLAGALPGSAASAVAVWWTGDLLGTLIVAPLLLAWVVHPPPPRVARGIAEVVALCAGTILAAGLVVGHLLPIPPLFRSVDSTYLLFPFVVWAAIRFGSRGAALMTFTVAAVAVWRTVAGGGPFNTPSGGGTLLSVACYLGAVAVTGLLLAAASARERESATDELRRRDEQLRIALDAARVGVWHWSAAENRLTWDEPLRRMYGLGAGDTVAGYDDFISRVHPDDREFVDGTVRRALAEGGRLDYEFRIVLPDGRVRWIADQGRVVSGGMTGTCQDVTDRRAAEEQLRLAHRMESVGRLAGGVAHEANNQMSVVIGAADFILRRADLPPAVRADTEHIRAAAERTAAVTAQLLAFSRRQILRPQRLDVNAVLERFRPVLQRSMGEDCALVIRQGAEIGAVRADPGQLEQVLLNLALNARDAMPHGGTLTIETAAVELPSDSAGLPQGLSPRPGRYALLGVSDTGHGMDRATLAQAFEPFFTTKEVGRGTGLGLATVYGIVKQSDGYVTADSEPGRGTAIRIFLPVSAEPLETGAEPRALPAAKGELVLVVEDEIAVREIAARTLAEHGHRVLEAASGAQAVELLRAGRRPALVLSDVVMPGMTAPELAAMVAKLAPGTRMLFTSGHADTDMVRRGLIEPGVAFLPKPFSPEGLVRAVRSSLDGLTAVAAEAPPPAPGPAPIPAGAATPPA
ncbi:MAG TPA: MASE1 domain-containing protein [Gemmatimonadales bacterium]